jgi:hypothetical protein
MPRSDTVQRRCVPVARRRGHRLQPTAQLHCSWTVYRTHAPFQPARLYEDSSAAASLFLPRFATSAVMACASGNWATGCMRPAAQLSSPWVRDSACEQTLQCMNSAAPNSHARNCYSAKASVCQWRLGSMGTSAASSAATCTPWVTTDALRAAPNQAARGAVQHLEPMPSRWGCDDEGMPVALSALDVTPIPALLASAPC